MGTVEGDHWPQTAFFVIDLLIKPFSPELILYVLLLVVLIICSALISGSEVAFFSLRGKSLQTFEDANTKNLGAITDLLERPRMLLATILISNNLINIAIIILFTTLADKIFEFEGHEILAFIIEVVVVTFILVLLGEVIPKIYASHAYEGFAITMAYPILALRKFFYPFAWLLVKYSKLLETRIEKQGHDVSLQELRKAIEITSDEQTTQEEKQILRGIVNFGNIAVTQIMTTRTDILAFDQTTPFSEVTALINEHRYSRIPVYEGNIDSIKGILYIKDLIPHLDEPGFDWTTLLRKPYFIPETKMIDDLLKEFQQMKVHLAIVVDEYGGTSGIVSLEDVLEEIVGEINDEFDEEDISYSKLSDDTYVFDGKTSLTDVVRVMDLEDELFEPYRGEAESIGGLPTEMLGRMPLINEVIENDNFTLTIESADRKRVKRVKIQVKQPREEEEN